MSTFSETDIMLIEDAIIKLKSKRSELSEEKQKLEVDLSDLNNRVRTNKYLPSDEYSNICRKQSDIKRRIIDRNKSLAELKLKINELENNRENIKRGIENIHVTDNGVTDLLIQMRDKYIKFSSDTSRISSMRAMASRFTEDIDIVLRALQK